MKASTRRQDICKAFLMLYQKNDIPQLSVRKLCETIPLARTSFYHYFDDLYGVLDAIMNDTLLELQKRNTDFYRINLQDRQDMASCYDTLYFIQAQADTFRALFRHQGTNGFVARWKKIIMQDFQKRYVCSNRSIPNLPVVLQLTSSAIVGLYEYWVFHPDQMTADEIAEGIFFLLCHTLL